MVGLSSRSWYRFACLDGWLCCSPSLQNLEKDDDVRKYVVAREAIRKKSNGKTFQKRPKIQRLVTPLTLQRKRHMYGSRCAVLCFRGFCFRGRASRDVRARGQFEGWGAHPVVDDVTVVVSTACARLPPPHP